MAIMTERGSKLYLPKTSEKKIKMQLIWLKKSVRNGQASKITENLIFNLAEGYGGFNYSIAIT